MSIRPSNESALHSSVALPAITPQAVWTHFATLCRFPRPSKNEGPLRDHLRQWAMARGLITVVDGAGNLIVRKAATPGRERVPTVILQAHLDMVCEKNDGVPHDFTRDPIEPIVRDGWLTASGTTLGADNGIGVALILAVLAGDALAHGPIEALLTVDEEAGMGCARGLDGGLLTGRLLLNLDTEEWGQFYLGCAGGMDVDVRRTGTPTAPPDRYTAWRIDLRGLRGGHSGVDIHEQRGNAIKLLVRLLCDLRRQLPLRLATLRGGSARNALPREAFAVVAVPDTPDAPNRPDVPDAPGGSRDASATLVDRLADWQTVLRQELAGIDDDVTLACAATTVSAVMSRAEEAIWLDSLQAAPHGVHRMSRRLPGVVETSNNLGIVDLRPDGGHCNFMVRSLRDSGSQALAAEIASLFALSESQVACSGHYPGWTPAADSPLLTLCEQVYRQRFGEQSTRQVIHAGLECGLIAAKIPGLDIVSFGPTIHGAHAPGEAVDIASVDRCWQLLQAILAAVA